MSELFMREFWSALIREFAELAISFCLFPVSELKEFSNGEVSFSWMSDSIRFSSFLGEFSVKIIVRFFASV